MLTRLADLLMDVIDQLGALDKDGRQMMYWQCTNR